MDQPTDGSAASAAWRELVSAHASVNKAIERAIAVTGVTLPQALALATLAAPADTPRTPSRLAAALNQESQSITGLLDRMGERGWVERHHDLPDRRAVRLSVTGSGAQKLAETTLPAREITTKIFTALTPAEVQLFIDLLQRINAAAQAQSASEEPTRHQRRAQR